MIQYVGYCRIGIRKMLQQLKRFPLFDGRMKISQTVNTFLWEEKNRILYEAIRFLIWLDRLTRKNFNETGFRAQQVTINARYESFWLITRAENKLLSRMKSLTEGMKAKVQCLFNNPDVNRPKNYGYKRKIMVFLLIA